MGTSPSRPTAGCTTRNSTTTANTNDDTISSTNSGNNNDDAIQQQQNITTDEGRSTDILETANIMSNATSSTATSPNTNNNTSNESSPNLSATSNTTSNNTTSSPTSSSNKPSSSNNNSTNNSTTNNSTTTTRKLRTNRSQPKRYIAHPSKYGLTNDEMDDLALKDDGDMKMSTKQEDDTDKKMSAKKKPSSAKKGKAKESTSTKSSTNGKAKQSSSNKPSSSLEEETNWSCHKCTTTNPISKSRCTNCKSWKDGIRTNYPTSLKKNGDDSTTKKKSSAMAGSAKGAAAAKSTSGKEGGDIGSTIGKNSGKKSSKKPSSSTASSSASSKAAVSKAASSTNTLEEEEVEDDDWTCHKCNNNNPSTRSRCTECLCWKGGTKEWKTTSSSGKKNEGSDKKKGVGKKKMGSVKGSEKKGSGKQGSDMKGSGKKITTGSGKKSMRSSDKKKKEDAATKSNGSAKKKKSPSSSTKGSGEKKVRTLDNSTTKKKQQGAKIDETKKSPSATTTSQKKRKRGTIASSTDNNEASLPIAKRSKSTTKQTTTTTTKQSTNTSSPSPRKKRTSCGTCTSCKRDDCGKCIACLDKVKFGGENKRKQKCFERRCVNLVPSGGGSGKKSNSATGKGVNGKSSNSKRRGDTKKSSSANQSQTTTMGAAFTQRKSSMSRRPRQFKPTEKMLASMQEDDDEAIGELSSRKGSTRRKIDDESDDDESNYDDVVCCLCKCAVDFSDKDFFLEPEESKAKCGEMDDVKKCGDGLKSNVDIEEEKKEEDDTSSSLVASTTKSNGKKSESEEEEEDEDDKPAFQLPYKFHNPGNALILCDGPAHANGKRFDNGSGEEYKCDRAYHQQCHFIPVLSIPRGPWRCLICRYRDEVYLKEKADRKNKNGQLKQEEDESVALSDAELNTIFRCMPVHSSSEGGADDIASGMKVEQVASATMNGNNNNNPDDECTINNLEKKFEFITADLKSSTLHAELTTRSRSLIKSSLATIRNAEHSLRTFTETSRARKALSDRRKLAERERNYGGDDDSDDGVGVELGLPQELCQCVMRIAVSKMRVREMIMGLENVIRSRPSHRGVGPSLSSGVSGDGEWRDAVSDLMQWYQQSKQAEEILALAINEDQSAVAAMNTTLSTTADSSKSLLHHLFPEGSLRRRRYEPRTGEAAQHTEEDTNDASSVTSISLDDLRCSSCLGTDACDDNDMLLCDGMGCYRSFHMQCLVPKVTLEDMQKEGAEDEDWFCPLCTAHANLIHFAQCEYFGDDPEEEESNEDMEEWEMARDVFSEAPFELRVAHKFKDNIFDDETTEFLAETMGIGGSSTTAHTGSETRERLDLLVEDDEEDDDFDHEEDDDDDESDLAEDNDMERRLLKEKIGKDELDALSITSDAASGSSDNENTGTSDDDEDSPDDEDNSNSGDGSSSDSNNPAPRRSKRRKFTLPDPEASGDDEGGNSDIGKLDVSNIVRGSRRRKAVDYRKLADVMFGDEEDEDAKGGLKKEYTPHEE